MYFADCFDVLLSVSFQEKENWHNSPAHNVKEGDLSLRKPSNIECDIKDQLTKAKSWTAYRMYWGGRE